MLSTNLITSSGLVSVTLSGRPAPRPRGQPSRDGKQRIGARPAHAAVFALEIFFYFLVILVDMAVGVDYFGDLVMVPPGVTYCHGET